MSNRLGSNIGGELLPGARQLVEFNKSKEKLGKKQDLTAREMGYLATVYGGLVVYAKASDVQLPDPEGIGVGPFEGSGEITGFSYGKYLSANGMRESGLVMYLGLERLNDIPASQSPWRNNVLRGISGVDTADSDLYTLGLPVKIGQKVIKLTKKDEAPQSVDELLLRGSEGAQEPFDYMDYVSRIDLITDGLPVLASDRVRNGVIYNELLAIGERCPYMGHKVAITSKNIRTHHPEQNSRMLIGEGLAYGVLRKFITAYYEASGQPRVGLQAVVYPEDIAEKVYSGEITAQQADETVAMYVPLSLPHVFEVLE
jgi:hypothetical protein